MNFQELEALRRFLVEINSRQAPSLTQYYDASSHGFYHRHDKKEQGRFSKSSTATCVSSLFATDKWRGAHPWSNGAEPLAKSMLVSEWTSAKLPRDNVFTVGFVLESVTDLLK